MSNASDRGWGDPGPGPHGLVLIPCPGIPLRVRAEVAPLFATLVQRLDAARRAAGKTPLTSSGGYNQRPVRGYEDRYARTKDPDLLSNHSWALAGDLCAGTNPMGAPLRTDMPAQTKAIAESCGLTWGAEWSRPDPMHFEFLGTPADAARWVALLTLTDAMEAGMSLDDKIQSQNPDSKGKTVTVRELLQDVQANAATAARDADAVARHLGLKK